LFPSLKCHISILNHKLALMLAMMAGCDLEARIIKHSISVIQEENGDCYVRSWV